MFDDHARLNQAATGFFSEVPGKSPALLWVICAKRWATLPVTLKDLDHRRRHATGAFVEAFGDVGVGLNFASIE